MLQAAWAEYKIEGALYRGLAMEARNLCTRKR
ncbi:hypothetical protein KP509_08G007400 [Ceratopteris richardii]|uniref:Uncharacterized protein n=1 Tax=Ceratopteris richardii TaxID=49495 RepID=A0A8T2U7U6_CERRI|nr:hypothetical protein KP509_08G007400 [Ceratopteris richardii]